MVRGVRRAAIVAIVGSLAVAAVLGIVALLTGEFGETQSKVVLTTLTVAGFGTTALCHLAIVARAIRLLGFVGIAASLAAAVCAFVLIWSDWSADWDRDGWLKALGVLAILAGSLAQANLLLLLSGRRHPAIRAVLVSTLLAIAAVAVMLWLPILTEGDIPGDHGDAYWRWLGVLGILDALGTIALPVLALVLRRASPSAAAETGESGEPASAGQLTVSLSPELDGRLDAVARARGMSREDAARAALERGLTTTD